MTVRTSKAERAALAEKRSLNRELRGLYQERKPLLTGHWIADTGWWGIPYCPRSCGADDCMGCMTREWLREKAEPLTARITELKQQLQQLAPKAEPAPLREATVTTGRGEQLVMFV
ncbi:hypothetical protein [Streptomyces sp. NPDC101455]|uniref:hypothetical protein n=1 Tax=Streptomyces sp. NPDC101455 TaxID=3366142 RepID=UPI003809621B